LTNARSAKQDEFYTQYVDIQKEVEAYAVLHDPVYRETYALNLKREFPRIPFYPVFAQCVRWGEALMAMHIGYEDVAPWSVEILPELVSGRGTTAEGGGGGVKRRYPSVTRFARATSPRQARGGFHRAQAHPEVEAGGGPVVVDADTQITGIPREAWDYRLGNRSAIDWVLDQHKEKTPRDPTIREKFNTYRFADYKESMIELLAKVVRVSVDTVAITEAMKSAAREG
jgi:predicted helicase